jgi:hypothetical protein
MPLKRTPRGCPRGSRAREPGCGRALAASAPHRRRTTRPRATPPRPPSRRRVARKQCTDGGMVSPVTAPPGEDLCRRAQRRTPDIDPRGRRELRGVAPAGPPPQEGQVTEEQRRGHPERSAVYSPASGTYTPRRTSSRIWPWKVSRLHEVGQTSYGQVLGQAGSGQPAAAATARRSYLSVLPSRKGVSGGQLARVRVSVQSTIRLRSAKNHAPSTFVKVSR